MPKQPKYTVVTPRGTFTRQTHRNYSHVVVVGRLRTDVIEQQHKAMCGNTSGAMRERWDALRIRKLEARATGKDVEARAWCGRLDLALAQTRKLTEWYDLVEVYATEDGSLAWQHLIDDASFTQETADV
jgi:hypothetical protein